MIGIKAYGVSVPYYRLKREDIHRAWQTMPFPMKGERTVANFDEDSLTLGVAASMDCLAGLDRETVDGIFYASTTFPYKEKLASTIAAAALHLRSDIRAADFSNSLRGCAIAMCSAFDAVKGDSRRNIIVVSSDCRLGAPSGELEQSIGDGGAAFLLGEEDLIAILEHRYTMADEFCGMWRSHEDIFVRMWEDRMVHDEGYSKILPAAIKEALDQSGSEIKDFDKVVYDAPADIRRHAQLAKKLGISKEQLQGPMFEHIGHTGSAMAAMMLVAALEEAKAGDRILFASYGNGADVFIFKVTDAISKVKNRGTFLRQMNNKRMISNYSSYLRWRDLVPIEAARRPSPPATSISNLHRNVKILLGLFGVKCKKCGTPQYTQAGMTSAYVMPQRVCVRCGEKDQFEDYCFADKKGVIFSYTQDKLSPCPDPPLSVAIIDFEGGGRGAFEMTDREPAEIDVGMPVEMTFRKLFSDRGIHNYYWKAKPIRN